ncbi:MAG: hypothetical protein ABI725_08430, partial [Chloroflexota bacterium]
MADSTSVRIRGRTTRERRIADDAEHLVAARSQAKAAAAAETGVAPARARMPDLSALTQLLATTGELRGLADRYRTVKEGRVGQNLRHVTYAAMPHGAKTFLAAALALGTGERLV